MSATDVAAYPLAAKSFSQRFGEQPITSTIGPVEHGERVLTHRERRQLPRHPMWRDSLSSRCAQQDLPRVLLTGLNGNGQPVLGRSYPGR